MNSKPAKVELLSERLLFDLRRGLLPCSEGFCLVGMGAFLLQASENQGGVMVFSMPASCRSANGSFLSRNLEIVVTQMGYLSFR
jgi:hypothetical protein